MDISIVVLIFNAKDVTLKMLDSLKQALNSTNVAIKTEVVVVDNGSTDGITQTLDEKHQKENWFKLIKGENVGFAKGNNLGVKHTNPNSSFKCNKKSK